MKVVENPSSKYLEQINIKKLQETIAKPKEVSDKQYYIDLQKAAKNGPIFNNDTIQFIENFPFELNKQQIKWIANLYQSGEVDKAGTGFFDNFQSILDYINNESPILEGKSLNEIKEESEEWHRVCFQGDQNKDASAYKTNNVFMKFDNGYTWVNVPKEDLVTEGDLMGHCVGTYVNRMNQKLIFSLRDKKGLPHITVEVWDYPGNKRINQIQGKQDKPPIKKYHEMIRLFIHEIGLGLEQNYITLPYERIEEIVNKYKLSDLLTSGYRSDLIKNMIKPYLIEERNRNNKYSDDSIRTVFKSSENVNEEFLKLALLDNTKLTLSLINDSNPISISPYDFYQILSKFLSIIEIIQIMVRKNMIFDKNLADLLIERKGLFNLKEKKYIYSSINYSDFNHLLDKIEKYKITEYTNISNYSNVIRSITEKEPLYIVSRNPSTYKQFVKYMSYDARQIIYERDIEQSEKYSNSYEYQYNLLKNKEYYNLFSLEKIDERIIKLGFSKKYKYEFESYISSHINKYVRRHIDNKKLIDILIRFRNYESLVDFSNLPKNIENIVIKEYPYEYIYSRQDDEKEKAIIKVFKILSKNKEIINNHRFSKIKDYLKNDDFTGGFGMDKNKFYSFLSNNLTNNEKIKLGENTMNINIQILKSLYIQGMSDSDATYFLERITSDYYSKFGFYTVVKYDKEKAISIIKYQTNMKIILNKFIYKKDIFDLIGKVGIKSINNAFGTKTLNRKMFHQSKDTYEDGLSKVTDDDFFKMTKIVIY